MCRIVMAPAKALHANPIKNGGPIGLIEPPGFSAPVGLLQLKDRSGSTEVGIEASGYAMRALQIDLIRDANLVLFAEVDEVADGQWAGTR